jgi:hypothetical protein
MDYSKIRNEATSFRSEMFKESIKDLRFGSTDPYVWGLRDWFKQNFDFSEGIGQYLLGNTRLEDEDFQTYKDRLWFQKQLIRFRNL